MKRILVLMLCFLIVGCATTQKINSVSLGMSKAEVIKSMGNPNSTSAIHDEEFLNYHLMDGTANNGWGGYDSYYVCLRDGRVISYGRRGDFGTTKDPTQVIKVLGDVKSEQKINIQTEDSIELEKKLKTLNKLLMDGLIASNEFDEQKKKLLNDYTSKKN